MNKIRNFSHTTNCFFPKKESKVNQDNNKLLIEKLAINLKLKYSNLFLQNNYTIKQLVKDITLEVKEDEVHNIQYNEYFIRIENIIMDKIRGHIKKKNCSSGNLITENDRKSFRTTVNLINNNEKNTDRKSLPSRMKMEISFKELDEWTKMALYNKMQYEEEMRLNKEKEKENQRTLNEYLSTQLREKNKINEKQKENDINLLKEHNKILEVLDKKEQDKINKYKNKLLNEKMIRDRLLSESIRNRRILKENEINTDKKMQERIKINILEDNKKQNEKKETEKEMFRKFMEENENNKRIKIENKEKETIDNLKFVREQIKYFEKQDQIRDLEKKKKLDKIKRLMDRFELIKSDEKGLLLREENLYLNEMKNREIIEKTKEKNEILRKIKLNQENRKGLDLQKQENKKMAETMRINDFKLGEKMHKSFKKYIQEKNDKFTFEKSKILKYKVELDKQILEKSKFKEPLIDKNEKLLNKEFLEKINKLL